MLPYLRKLRSLAYYRGPGFAQYPPKFFAGQLRAIVGVEMGVESVEAKAKLSQNRSQEDVAGVIDGLSGTPGEPVADAMRRL